MVSAKHCYSTYLLPSAIGQTGQELWSLHGTFRGEMQLWKYESSQLVTSPLSRFYLPLLMENLEEKRRESHKKYVARRLFGTGGKRYKTWKDQLLDGRQREGEKERGFKKGSDFVFLSWHLRFTRKGVILELLSVAWTGFLHNILVGANHEML